MTRDAAGEDIGHRRQGVSLHMRGTRREGNLAGIVRAGRRLAMAAALTAGLAVPAAAHAAPGIGTHGPASEAFGWFPEWYEDSSGTQLELCVEGPYCMTTIEGSLPEPDQPARFPDNFPDEAFWWAGDATLTYPGGSALLTMAQEAAFANDTVVAGDQIVFGRVRLRADGLAPGAWYRITYPYGQVELRAGSASRSLSYTSDVGCLTAPCAGDAFAETAGSLIGPDFLQWDTTGSAPPEGYIGNPTIAHRVTGSRFVPPGESEPANFFRIERITGEGGTVTETVGRTDFFLVQGKLAGPARGHFAAAPVQFGEREVGSTAERTATIHNSGVGDLALGIPRIAGDDGDDFALASGGTCALPATIAPGASCTLRVSFSPAAARDHRARIDIPEDAAGGATTRSVPLSGVGKTAPAPVAPLPAAPAASPASPASLGASPASPAASPASVVPGAGAAVLGAAARSSRPTVRALTMRSVVARARAHVEGLRLVLRISGEANVVRVRVYRMRGGRRGAKVAEVFRSPTANPVRVRLADGALRRRLTPGRYIVDVAAGRDRGALGAAVARTLRIVR